MKIFITGGSGFIGKQLIPILGKHELLCLTRSAKNLKSSKNVQCLIGDLCNPESYLPALDEFRPDCCIHLAWYGLPDYSIENNKINLISGINLVECLKKVGCKKIFAVGSCWEYGNAKKSLSEKELPIDPGQFALFKTSLRMIINKICNENNINLVWGRVFFVYGPGQRQTSLIPTCYNSLKNGIELKINNPLTVNDYIYVSDVAKAIRHLIELSDISGIYNIGSGKGVPVWEVVNYIASTMKIPHIYKNMPSSDLGNWANIDSLNKCGWKSETSLEAGIFNTINTLELI
jgi:nucleoside-diphosphate-sugar epimerase